ncbi:hypothetical protein, partial [Mannheimia indoligenes]|uniref:hypothetical protein n=1 Tax=Mannheimia indoligenes TaxID=3103145 RepID=UPI002FE4FDB0
YQIFDSLGRVVQVLVDNDGKASTGVSRTDNEGAPVAGIDQVLAYSYNVKGEVTEMKRDNDVDGKYDYREAYTLDANGRWVEKLIDLTNDNQFDRKEVYTKSASDAYLKTEFYNIVDARDVATKIEYYENNANNQRTAMKVDTLGDASINAITRYDLDALGRTEKAYFDTDGDGNVDRTETYLRDVNGGLTEMKSDSNNDTIIDAVRYYERDALGRVSVEKFDNDNNGIIDDVYTFTRDQYGNIVHQIRDLGNDNIIDVEYTNTFNELNQQVNQVAKWLDGRVSHLETTYDDYGRVSVEDRRWDTASGSQGVPYRYTYQYDDQNRQIVVEYDNRIDGVIDWTDYRSYEHPVFTNAVTKNEIVYPNGNKATHSIVEHDAAGRAVLTYSDATSDGAIERLNIGDRNGSSSVSRNVDLTTWTEEQFAELGNKLTAIVMGALSPDTLTLNAEVMAKLTQKYINVQTTGNDDTLNLSGFEKSKAAAKTIGSETFDLYTATVNGKVFELFVDDDTNVVLG